MEKNFKKILFLICFVPLFLCLTACDKNKSISLSQNYEMPEQVIKGFAMNRYESAVHKWNFYSKVAELDRKKDKLAAYGVKMVFFEKGKTDAVMYADKAFMNTKTGDIKAVGNVVINCETRNIKVYTDTMDYNEKTGNVYTDSFVRQEKEDVIVTGYGLKGNVDMSEITILKNVKVIKKAENVRS